MMSYFFNNKILYISINEIKRESIIGPKIKPSGPKKIIPPKMANKIKNGGTSRPLPKKYADSILSTKTERRIPNNPIAIAV